MRNSHISRTRQSHTRSHKARVDNDINYIIWDETLVRELVRSRLPSTPEQWRRERGRGGGEVGRPGTLQGTAFEGQKFGILAFALQYVSVSLYLIYSVHCGWVLPVGAAAYGPLPRAAQTLAPPLQRLSNPAAACQVTWSKSSWQLSTPKNLCCLVYLKPSTLIKPN